MPVLDQSYPEDVLKRLHESMLEILDAIAEVCERNDIKWYVAAGSTLGAARHGGFIPWDDDIDVGMLREHYDRFLEVAPRELPDRFELLTPETTPNYAPLFSKVCIKGTRFWTDETMEAGLRLGIFVDVWPRDRVAADPKVRKHQERASNLLRGVMYLYYSKNVHARLKGMSAKVLPKLFPLAHVLIHRFTTPEKIRAAFTKHTRLKPGEPSIGTTAFPASGFRIVPEEFFVDCDKVPFEGRMYPVPSPIEEYCEISYGKTWRELPPMEKRVNHAPLVLDFGDGINVFENAASNDADVSPTDSTTPAEKE